MTKHRCSTSEMEAISASHLGGPFIVAFDSGKKQIIVGEQVKGTGDGWKMVQTGDLKKYAPKGSIIVTGNLAGDVFEYDEQSN